MSKVRPPPVKTETNGNKHRAPMSSRAAWAVGSLYRRHPVVAAIAPVSIVAGLLCAYLELHIFSLTHAWTAWLLWPVIALVHSELLMSLISILLATGFCTTCLRRDVGRYADLERLPMPPKAGEIEVPTKPRGTCPTPQEGLRRAARWRPPQVVRWDILTVLGSRIFGYAASIPLPVFLRGPVYRTYAKITKAKLHEVERPLSSFPNLRSFFTRTLKPGLRPVCMTTALTSPVDGRVVICGVVSGDRVEQVKGVTYSMAQFLGEHHAEMLNASSHVRRQWEISEEAVAQRSGGRNKLFHLVIYLDPGDYHRMHAPCDFTIQRLRHFPGTLFPISPVLTRLLPNLFALNERVVLCGKWKHGAFSFTAVGAYNVGSIEMEFDKSVSTNRIRRDLRNPNIELLSYGGVGSHAYVRRYDEPPETPVQLIKGRQLGLFNLGSTVVLIFEAPSDFQFDVAPGERVRLGQSLGQC
eukprot:TRINITY_DN7121_c0_g1_i1.p1 TRINITY_DN7121_c0_g1~~TRINITY_DN7121_c0_g1_i1.p1  ORF type:complete len:498 (+),score=123.58 TRINITY_DN7121_c0_g1_i1:91-1494(+)